MSSFHHIQHPHLQPPEDNQDRVSHLIPFFPLYDPSPFAYPTLSLHSSQAQALHQEVNHQHHEDVEIPPSGGSGDPLLFVLHRPPTEEGDPDDHERGTAMQQRHVCDAPTKSSNGSAKWMSSKMRLMRKMMNSDTAAIEQKPQRRSVEAPLLDQQGQQPAGIVRVCSDCNTTKTPLWRSGPQGPKSLCNACGIRQRKARKAMAAAAAVNSTGSDLKHQDKATGSDVNHQDKAPRDKCLEDGGSAAGSGGDHLIVPFKKRCKFATSAGATNANGLEDSGMGLGQNPQLHKAFPEDEKEAAILLMALSCGLVCR